MTGIYVASKTRHAPTWRVLRASGLPVTSTWIDAPWLCGGPQPTPTDRGTFWETVVEEIKASDLLLLYRVGGEELEGAWIEAGIALGADVPIYAVGVTRDELLFKEAVTCFPNLDGAVEAARAVLGLEPTVAAAPALSEVS